MLPPAAAANPEMKTPWLDPVRRVFMETDNVAFHIFLPFSRHLNINNIPRDQHWHKNNNIIDACNRIPFSADVRDFYFFKQR
jgi:hypothetical protein